MPKKLLISILIVMFAFYPITVFADYDDKDYSYITDEAEKRIINALEAHEVEVDISDFDISKDDVNGIISRIIEENAQLFYVNREYSISYGQLTGDVISITFSFKYSDSELDIKINDFNSRIDMITDEIKNSSDELEIIHSCHDYIVENYSYDETKGSTDAYNMLLTKKGTCMAYTSLYGYILKQYGIESTVVNSKQLNHIWNAVQLNGEYYNVDVTWDDPIGGSSFFTSHKYLMKSDEYFEANDHEGRSSKVECTSKLYDKHKWGDESIFSQVDDVDSMIEYLLKLLPIFSVVLLAIIITAVIIISVKLNKRRNHQNNNYYPTDY